MSIFDLVYQDRNYYPRPTSFLCDRLQDDLDGRNILDLGCGNGRNALELLRRGARVLAADPSITGIEALRKQAEVKGFDSRLETHIGSVPPMDEQILDGVVLSTVLDHMHRAEAIQALRAISPALANDSWVYASVFTTADPGNAGQSASETTDGVVNYWDPLDFASQVRSGLSCDIASLSIDWSEDTSHGPRHFHHLLRMFALRGQPIGVRVGPDAV